TYWSDVGAIPQYLESNFDALDGIVKLQTNIEDHAKKGIQQAVKEAGGHALGEGTTVHETAKIDAILMTGKNCDIGADAKLSGHVVLGDNCIVEEGVSLTNCLVWANSKIGKGSQLSNTVVAGNTTVEPNSSHERAALVPQRVEPKKLASNGVK
ncbi:MAG TPA: NDP-sugar synthase, partial [Candidatus Melainabacteria bacterium]|nr:NDP-sugar synthase [Candidatus Melainabacteria bacterium]